MANRRVAPSCPPQAKKIQGALLRNWAKKHCDHSETHGARGKITPKPLKHCKEMSFKSEERGGGGQHYLTSRQPLQCGPCRCSDHVGTILPNMSSQKNCEYLEHFSERVSFLTCQHTKKKYLQIPMAKPNLLREQDAAQQGVLPV